eukprot:1110890-Amphidinium_carterae.1
MLWKFKGTGRQGGKSEESDGVLACVCACSGNVSGSDLLGGSLRRQQVVGIFCQTTLSNATIIRSIIINNTVSS